MPYLALKIMLLNCFINISGLQDHWSTAETGCLFGRTLVRKPNVPTLNDCRALCEDNKDCLSVDYQPSRKVCRLNNADKDIEPIMADCEGYKHSERIRRKFS